ncbi:MAG: hypothetical protein KGI29_03445 [Pseudomonadota bacterium]|nr:hypothetical protein [Pseudomonadota bacterium]MDE3037987.1 hypothetical protein [Pseudomonadota bacterium]
MSDGETALVFKSEGKLVVGVITDTDGRIIAQILNPETRPAADIKNDSPPQHRCITVNGREYIAIDMPPSTVTAFTKTANTEVCSSDMLCHFGNMVNRLRGRPIFEAAQHPRLN